ncbi:MAG: hypothetical protein AB1Z55_12465 [Acidimicrobiia bacterium]
MSGAGALVLGGVLLGVFLLLVAALLWQEARTRGQPAEPVYGIEDATDHVLATIPDEVRQRLGRDNVRRVLEWQVFFLQMLARDDAEVPIVVGTTDGTVDYIGKAVARQGHPMSEGDIATVLEAQGAYLRSIGVVGEEAEPGEVFGDPDGGSEA